MATAAQVLKIRRGTAAENAAFTGANAELTVDTDNKNLRLHDGVTVGGSTIYTKENLLLSTIAAGLGQKQAGSGARTDRSVQDKLNDVWDVSDYVPGEGVANGDPTQSYTTWPDITSALQAFFTRTAAEKRPIVCSRPIYGRMSDAVTLLPPSFTNPVGFNVALPVDLWNLTIAYTGTRNKNVVTMGDVPGSNRYDGGEIWHPRVFATGALQWPLAATNPGGTDTGIRMRNVWRTTIHENLVYGFSKGVEYVGCPYNELKGGFLYDNRFQRVWTTEGTNLDQSFSNQNNIYGTKLSCSSASAALGTRYGDVFTWDKVASYRGHNNNTFHGINYELGAGGNNAHPVWFDGVGLFNSWHDCRSEGNKGYLAIIDGGGGARGFGNTFHFKYMNYAGQINALQQVNNAYGNRLTGPGCSEASWDSGSLASAISSSGTAAAYIKGRELFFLNAGTPTLANVSRVDAFSTAIKAAKGGVCLDSGGYARIAVAIDTSVIKDFRCWYSTGPGAFYGRPFFMALDANGALLTGAATDPTWGNENYVKGGPVLEQNVLNAGANGYSPGSDTAFGRSIHVTVRDEVKTLIFCVSGGTTKVLVTGMGVTAYVVPGTYPALDGIQGLRVFSLTHTDDGSIPLASANPSSVGVHGVYSRGQRVGNTAAASGGTVPPGWVCSVTGYRAPAWAISTAYTIPGLLVTNDSGKIYELKTPGTSAGAGGPTGTGTGITDNTCVWDYIGVLATHVNEANAP